MPSLLTTTYGRRAAEHHSPQSTTLHEAPAPASHAPDVGEGTTPVVPRPRRATDSTTPKDEDWRVIRNERDVNLAGLYSWTCLVESTRGKRFTAEVVPDPGTPGTTVLADFNQNHLERPVEVGDVFYMTTRFIETEPGAEPIVHRSAQLRHMGRWNEEEVAEIWAYARERAAQVQRLVAR